MFSAEPERRARGDHAKCPQSTKQDAECELVNEQPGRVCAMTRSTYPREEDAQHPEGTEQDAKRQILSEEWHNPYNNSNL